MFNKLSVMWRLLRSDNFVVLTDKGFHSVTPIVGHKRTWADMQEGFNLCKAGSDRKQNERMSTLAPRKSEDKA